MENFESKSSHRASRTIHHPSFFQIYLREHNSMALGIPPPFMKNFKGSISRKVSLRNSSGRIWPAKLEYIDKKLHITRGWNHYATDNLLKCGEFVVLTYKPTQATFLVQAYASDALIKQMPQEKITSKGDIGTKSTQRDADDVTRVGNLRFSKIYRIGKFKNYVSVPNYVLDSCAFQTPQSIKLSNDKGYSIGTELRRTQDRIVVGYAGVERFIRRNNVQDGDELEFEIICGNGDKIKEVVMKNISQSKKLLRGY